MPIEVNEKIGSRPTGTRSSEWMYTITGTADHAEAVQALYDDADGSNGTWKIENLQVDPVYIDESDADACIWEGSVTFVPVERKKDDPLEAGQSQYNFDTGGGSQHITHIRNAAHHMVTYTIAGAAEPDMKGGIGVTADGIEGCDIMVPVFNFSETHILPSATVTQAYKGKLFELTARTNAGVFRGLAIGECLFLGASGTQRGDGDWEITFRFAGSPNVLGMQIGEITDINKDGWEYLWVRSERRVDAAAKIITMSPVTVHIEQVYESGDFDDLEIAA